MSDNKIPRVPVWAGKLENRARSSEYHELRVLADNRDGTFQAEELYGGAFYPSLPIKDFYFYTFE